MWNSQLDRSVLASLSRAFGWCAQLGFCRYPMLYAWHGHTPNVLLTDDLLIEMCRAWWHPPHPGSLHESLHMHLSGGIWVACVTSPRPSNHALIAWWSTGALRILEACSLVCHEHMATSWKDMPLCSRHTAVILVSLTTVCVGDQRSDVSRNRIIGVFLA